MDKQSSKGGDVEHSDASSGQAGIKREIDVDDSSSAPPEEAASPEYNNNTPQLSNAQAAPLDTSPVVNVTTDHDNHSPSIATSAGGDTSTSSAANVSSDTRSDSSHVDVSQMQQSEVNVQEDPQQQTQPGLHYPHPMPYFSAATERLSSPVQVSSVSGASSIQHATSVISAVGQVCRPKSFAQITRRFLG